MQGNLVLNFFNWTPSPDSIYLVRIRTNCITPAYNILNCHALTIIKVNIIFGIYKNHIIYYCFIYIARKNIHQFYEFYTNANCFFH